MSYTKLQCLASIERTEYTNLLPWPVVTGFFIAPVVVIPNTQLDEFVNDILV